MAHAAADDELDPDLEGDDEGGQALQRVSTFCRALGVSHARLGVTKPTAGRTAVRSAKIFAEQTGPAIVIAISEGVSALEVLVPEYFLDFQDVCDKNGWNEPSFQKEAGGAAEPRQTGCKLPRGSDR